MNRPHRPAGQPARLPAATPPVERGFPSEAREAGQEELSIAWDCASTADGEPQGSPTEQTALARAQFHALVAVHDELRHGHDQQTRYSTAIERQTDAMIELAGAMHQLREQLHIHLDGLQGLGEQDAQDGPASTAPTSPVS